MAEYIEREKALEECDWYANEFCECEYAIMPLKGALENLPAADVIEALSAENERLRKAVLKYEDELGILDTLPLVDQREPPKEET